LLSNAHVNLLKNVQQVKGLGDVRVFYNTNGTQTVSDEILNLWEKCKLIELYFSIDDVGTRFDYQRTGADWNQVIANLKYMDDKIRFFPTMVKFVGFKSTSINIEHANRAEGKSTYSFKKLTKLALDIILANSDKPMRLTVRLGFYVASFAIIFGMYIFFRALFYGFAVSGYASIIFSIWFLSGLILATLGIVGLYIGKIFEGVKNRPVYIIDKETT
jgi:hypothetical protein